jgi:hypothetical protein
MVGSRTARILIVSLSLGACGLEGELVGPIMDRGHVLYPDARDTVITGRVGAHLIGATVSALRQGGASLGGAVGVTDEAGVFILRFPGVLGARGALISAELGAVSALGLVPEVPMQPTVFHEERWIALGDVHPVLAELGVESTVAALMVSRAAHINGASIGTLSADAILDALDQAILGIVIADSPAADLARMVATLNQAAVASSQMNSPWALESLSEGPVVHADWLAAELVDLDGDGWRDVNAAVMDAALDEAAAALDLSVCYVTDSIKVVFQVEINDGVKDGNCAALDPYKWAADVPASRVFFTGGIHSDTPICDEQRVDACLPIEAIEETDQSLGAWEPNLVPMWDDGSHGDIQGEDGVWTLELELPYWDPNLAQDGAGLRLGYKYTHGMPGQGWTSTEEWPGNKRILELADLNGDHMVVRRDTFGDEASNKDKANALKPSLGGCGTNVWLSDVSDGCTSDTRERMVDTDDDCEVDDWPRSGPAVPLVRPCAPAP